MDHIRLILFSLIGRTEPLSKVMSTESYITIPRPIRRPCLLPHWKVQCLQSSDGSMGGTVNVYAVSVVTRVVVMMVIMVTTVTTMMTMTTGVQALTGSVSPQLDTATTTQIVKILRSFRH